MSGDFPTWPIFIVLGVIFLMVMFDKVVPRKKYSSVQTQSIAKVLHLLVIAGIAISLFHDSTSALGLYF